MNCPMSLILMFKTFFDMLKHVLHMFEENPSCIILSYFLRESCFETKLEFFFVNFQRKRFKPPECKELLYVSFWGAKQFLAVFVMFQLFDEIVVSVNSELYSEIAYVCPIKVILGDMLRTKQNTIIVMNCPI